MDVVQNPVIWSPFGPGHGGARAKPGPHRVLVRTSSHEPAKAGSWDLGLCSVHSPAQPELKLGLCGEWPQSLTFSGHKTVFFCTFLPKTPLKHPRKSRLCRLLRFFSSFLSFLAKVSKWVVLNRGFSQKCQKGKKRCFFWSKNVFPTFQLKSTHFPLRSGCKKTRF